MTTDEPSARRAMVRGAAEMISRRGMRATSVREVARHSNAPLGSTYHYFPRGKDQLAAEAVGYVGDIVARQLQRALAAGPREGIRVFVGLWKQILDDSGYAAGCPVMAVAVEEPGEDATEAPAAAAAVFAGWREILVASLAEAGTEPARAGDLADTIVAAVEGAVAVCRTERSSRALDSVGRVLDSLVAGGDPA